MTNAPSYKICEKSRYRRYDAALEQAFMDERQYHDYRKVYYCWDCASWHTSRERVNTNVPLLER